MPEPVTFEDVVKRSAEIDAALAPLRAQLAAVQKQLEPLLKQQADVAAQINKLDRPEGAMLRSLIAPILRKQQLAQARRKAAEVAG